MGKYKMLEKLGLDRPAEKVSVWKAMGRNEEFERVHEKYPEYPWKLLLKTDALRRGVMATDAFVKKSINDYYERSNSFFQWHSEDLVADAFPLTVKYSDGTLMGVCLAPEEDDPYTMDVVDGRFFLKSDDKVLDELFLLPKPPWYGKKTSKGTPMDRIVGIAGDLLYICPSHHCHYWNEGLQCRFCDIDYMAMFSMKMGRGFRTKTDPEELYETVCEVVQRSGEYHNWFFTGGADPRSDYTGEVDFSVQLLTAIKRGIKDTLGVEMEHLPVCLIISPFTKGQLQICYDAGASAFGGYLETWDKDQFELVCPGKAKYFGRDEHIKRTVEAVEIFGEGNVNCGHTIGVEMAPPPYGFAEIDDALESTLTGYSFWIDHDVVPTGTNWRIEPGTDFYKMGATCPPLEFYAKVDLGRHILLKDYLKKNGKGISNDQLGLQNFQPFSCYADFQKFL